MLGDLISAFNAPQKLNPPSVFRDLMESRWTGPTGEVSLPPTRGVEGDLPTYLRASSIGKLCGRRAGFHITGERAVMGSTKAEYMMALHIGTAFHNALQDFIMPQLLDGDRILGWWVSSDGRALTGSDEIGFPILYSKSEAVESLKTDHVKYMEVYAVNHESMVGGHPDMVIDWRGSGIAGAPDCVELQEFKTIDPTMWNKVDPYQGGGPGEGYVLQVQVYLWLTGLDQARLTYFKKGERRTRDNMAEFVITKTDDVVKMLEDRVKTYWDDVDRAFLGGMVTENQPCDSFSRFPASWCPFRYECFGKTRRATPIHREMTENEKAEWKG